jgi:hypothetical protein
MHYQSRGKKVAQKCGKFLLFLRTAQSKQLSIRRKFAENSPNLVTLVAWATVEASQ